MIVMTVVLLVLAVLVVLVVLVLVLVVLVVVNLKLELLLGRKVLLSYSYFWVILRRLNFICRRFGTHRLLHLHRRRIAYTTYLDGTDRVFRNVGTKLRRRGITERKEYDIQNTAKV